jgi:ribosomal protein S18 acetylase RimI-like enzyme
VSIVPYVVDLAKKNSDALSFIPAPRLEEYDRNGQILASFENDEPCGFLVFGKGETTMHVYQACIQYDSRRREHGLELVRRLVAAATRRGCRDISLWCADDLESNDFWRAAGFIFAGQRQGGRTRGRLHNRWMMPLAPSLGLDAPIADGIVYAAFVDKAPRRGRTALSEERP